jgi:hypothetical protein
MISMTPKKKVVEEEEEEDFEDDSIEEESFSCRECKSNVEMGQGDDMISLCDDCMEKYNVDKIWKQYDAGKIEDDDLKTFDLTPYLLKKK